MTDDTTFVAEPVPGTEDETVKAAFARLYSNGRAYADAEIERQKLRAGIVGSSIEDAVIFGAVGFLLAVSALIALLVGLIITITPLIGAGWATAVVVGVSLLAALALLLMARSRISRMMKAIR